MITEQYVTFETAKMLKEAGFEAECSFIIDDDGRKLYRPTQALAARWLRETHGFHVFAKRAYDYILSRHTWGFWIQRAKYDTTFSLEIGFDSYETALEAGLQEILQKIIKNKDYEKDNVQ